MQRTCWRSPSGGDAVARHLANIFTKIGVSSRTAAAAWAHRNGVTAPRFSDLTYIN